MLFTVEAWAAPSSCSKGASYWCRDETTAKECGTLMYCQQNVWQNQQKSMKNEIDSVSQMLCKVIVQASKDLLTDRTMKIDEIKDYLRKDCSKLPNQQNLIQKVVLTGFIEKLHKHLSPFSNFSVKQLSTHT